MEPPAEPALAGRLRRWMEIAMASSPSVASDGETLLYVSDAPGIPVAHRTGTDGTSAVRFGPMTERADSVHASPKGPRAVLSTDAGGDEHWQLSLWEFGEGSTGRPGIPLTRAPEVVHLAGSWTDDGRHFLFASNQRDRRFFDVYDVAVDRPGPPRCVRAEDSWCEVVGHRGGTTLVRRRNTNLDADLIEVSDRGTTILTPHSGELTIASATVGGPAIYAAANPDREFTALVQYRPGRPGHEFLREYSAEVEIVAADRLGSRLALTVNREGVSELHLYELATSEDRRVPVSPRGVVGAIDWWPDGTALAYTLSSPEGQEIYRLDVERGKSRRLTRSPSPPPTLSREPRPGRFRASDGVHVPYWDYRPNAQPPRGTILHVHGGPEAQARPSFAPLVQFLVAEGWRVVLPNVRGSTGYGRTFVHLDDRRHRMDSVRDLCELVVELRRDPMTRDRKVGVIGGSYGGFMVLASIATYPDLFDAAVDLVGISNFVTFLEETGPWRRKLREAEYGSLDEDRAFLESISPVRHAEAIRSPLLVVHGRNDPRVPLHEARQIVDSLASRGRPVELLVFDDEGHGLVRRPNRLAAWTRAAEFFEHHLSPPTG